MEKVPFGKTGLEVTPLGLGLAEFTRHADARENYSAAGRILNAALDGGINILDTAACYANAEDMIGSTIAHRREEYVLATKAGHAIADAPNGPWTAETIEHSINRSLQRMKTDHIDLLQVHSCNADVLKRGEVAEAFVKAQDAGKTRFIGFSGDNEAARWAVESGIFATLQTSYSLVEQHARTRGLLEAAEAQGMGVIIKRPIANSIWRKDASPYPYADEYFRRGQIMNKEGPFRHELDDPILLSTGFVLAAPQVDTVITGTHNPDHLKANIEMMEMELPIPQETVHELYKRFEDVEDDWRQLT